MSGRAQMQTRMNRWGVLAGFAMLAMMGCDDTDDGIDGVDAGADVGADSDADVNLDAGRDTSDILGTWVDSFATEYTITSTEWRQTFDADISTYAILTLDRDSMVVIAENGADNAFSPGKFSRFDWTQFDDRLFYCQSAFDAETAEAAASGAGSDPSDPENGGCGGMFPWTELLVP